MFGWRSTRRAWPRASWKVAGDAGGANERRGLLPAVTLLLAAPPASMSAIALIERATALDHVRIVAQANSAATAFKAIVERRPDIAILHEGLVPNGPGFDVEEALQALSARPATLIATLDEDGWLGLDRPGMALDHERAAVARLSGHLVG